MCCCPHVAICAVQHDANSMSAGTKCITICLMGIYNYLSGKELLHNSRQSPDGCPTLLSLPQPRHAWKTVCTVAGTGVWRRDRGNDLQRSVLSAGIITGPDLWQDTCQQLPTRPGPQPEAGGLGALVYIEPDQVLLGHR